MGANTKMYKIKPKIAKGMLAFGPKKNIQKFFTKNTQTTKYKILINVFMILVFVFLFRWQIICCGQRTINDML